MRIAYFDCLSGVSGNMMLGALIGLGAAPERIVEEVRKLRPGPFELRVSDVRRGPLAAKHVEVSLSGGHAHPHRAYEDIRVMIDRAPLDPRVKELSKRVFERLAQAEAKVHGTRPEAVTFHEVGAVDAIVDIVGSCAGLVALDVARVESSPFPLGRGRIDGMHGPLPLPAPATVELLAGAPVYGVSEALELVTPTGAALVTALACAFGPIPAMRLLKTAHGAGDDRPGQLPNVLRVLLGETEGPYDADTVCVLETNIDDLNPEVTAYLAEQLVAAGALDVSLASIQMKKGRPGTALRVIARETDREDLARMIFEESSAIGLRVTRAERMLLARQVEVVDTTYGALRVKVARGPEGLLTLHPEYEDCRRAAQTRGVALREVMEAAREAARAKFKA